MAEEHSATRTFLIDNRTADGDRALAAEDRAKAMALLDVEHPDLSLVDVNGDTLAMLDAMRSASGLASRTDPDTPLIVLTSRPGAIHRIRLLERGSDDVLAKPFAYPELRARIAALIRRTDRRPGSRIRRVGPLTIDVPSRGVRVGDQPIKLSAKEYELLLALASDPPAFSPARNCSATCGASARRSGREPSTAMPTGYARSSPALAPEGWS